MCTNVRGPGDLNTEEINELIRKSLNNSRSETVWGFNIHSWSWHDAHCVYSCPFCKSFSKAKKDAHVRSRNMNNDCCHQATWSCYTQGHYATPVPKKVRVLIMKDHGNLNIFMTESAARGLITNWQGGISRTITIENYSNARKYTILTKSISSISVEDF